jgi:hypothetical protein
MPFDIGEAWIRIRPDMTGFSQEVRAKTEESTRGAVGGLAKLAVGTLALGGIAEFIRGTANAAESVQVSLRQVDNTIRNTASGAMVENQRVTTRIKEDAQASGFAVGDVSQAFIRLDTQTHNSALSLKLVGTAMDIARARGIQLTQAATLLAREQGGAANAFQRYGIAIPKVTTAQDALAKKIADVQQKLQGISNASARASAAGEKLTAGGKVELTVEKQHYEQLLKNLEGEKQYAAQQDKNATATAGLALVQKDFAGASALYANTAAGAQARFRVSVEELQASIGQHFLPVIRNLENELTRYAIRLTNSKSFQREVQTGVNDLTAVFKGLVSVVSTVGPPLLTVANALVRIGSAIGAMPLLTFVATWKIINALFGQSKTETEQNTAATTAQTAAIEAQTAAYEQLAAAIRLAAGAQAAQTAEAETAAAANTANDISKVGAGAGGLAGLIPESAVTLGATAAVAGLAAGMVFLASRDDEVTAANHRLQGSLNAVAGATVGLKSAQQGISASRNAIAAAQLAKEYTQNEITQARIQLGLDKQRHASSTVLIQDSLNLKTLVGQLAQDNNALATAHHNETASERAAVIERNKQAVATDQAGGKVRSLIQALGLQNTANFTGRVSTAAYSKQIDQVATQAIPGVLTKLGDLRKEYQNQAPQVSRAIGFIAQYIKTTGQIPSSKLTKLLLDDSNSSAKFKTAFANLEAYAKSHPDALLYLNTTSAQNALQRFVTASLNSLLKVRDAAVQVTDFHHPGAAEGPTVVPTPAPIKPKPTPHDTGNQDGQTYLQGWNDAMKQFGPSTAKQTAAATKGVTDQQIKQAVSQAITQAKQQIGTLAGNLAGSIGQIIDRTAQIAADKLAHGPVASAIRTLQAQINAEQALQQRQQLAQQLRDARFNQARMQNDAPLQQQLLNDQLSQAQEQLAALQQAGPQAGQTQTDFAVQVDQATLAVRSAQEAITDYGKSMTSTDQAVATAQDAITADAKQRQLTALQARQTAQQNAIQARATAEKDAVTRRLADLADQFDRGLISEKTFHARLVADLKKYDVNYKEAGALLGSAFATGYLQSIQGLAKETAGIQSGSIARAAERQARQSAAAGTGGGGGGGTVLTSAAVGGSTGNALADVVRVGMKYGMRGRTLEAFVATAIQEGGSYGSVGDQGTSFGPFQFHQGGALGSHSIAWAQSINEVIAEAARWNGIMSGAGAAALQRPADQAGYARSVDAIIASGQAAGIIAKYANDPGFVANLPYVNVDPRMSGAKTPGAGRDAQLMSVNLSSKAGTAIADGVTKAIRSNPTVSVASLTINVGTKATADEIAQIVTKTLNAASRRNR